MRHRTALITAASVAGVVLAGATAVGASLGILDATADTSVGQLSAATSTTTMDVPVAESVATSTVTTSSVAPLATTGSPTIPPAPTSAPTDVRRFAVEDAGVVTLARTATGLELVQVQPSPGWRWAVTDQRAETVTVVLESPGASYALVAVATPTGIDAGVQRLSTSAPAAPSPTVAAPSADDHESEVYEHEDEDEGHEDEDHEDEDHEYEGADDDD